MAISIRQAFSNVASNKYNKRNLLFYVLFFFCYLLICLLAPDYNNKQPNMHQIMIYLLYFSIAIPLSFLFYYFSLGIIVTAYHNAIHSIDGVFPDVKKDIKSICVNLAKVLGGEVILGTIILLLLIITLLISFCLYSLNEALSFIVFGLFVSIILIYSITFHISLHLNYYHSLEFLDLINFKKAILLLKETNTRFVVFFIKSIFIVLLFLLSLFVIIVPCVIIAVLLYDNIQNQYSRVLAFGIPFCILLSFLWGGLQAMLVDLTGQFMQETLEKRQVSVSS